MDRSNALVLVRQVVAEVLAVEPAKITEEAKLRDDLGADSLDLVEVATAIEDMLGVRLPEHGLKEVATVGQALDMVVHDGRIVDGE